MRSVPCSAHGSEADIDARVDLCGIVEVVTYARACMRILCGRASSRAANCRFKASTINRPGNKTVFCNIASKRYACSVFLKFQRSLRRECDTLFGVADSLSAKFTLTLNIDELSAVDKFCLIRRILSATKFYVEPVQKISREFVSSK